MRVTVHWHPTAVEQLAAIWWQSAPDDRSLLQESFDFCDRRLQSQPESAGVPLDGTPLYDFVRLNATDRIREIDWPRLRMLDYEGAVIVFSVDDEIRRVNVWFVCRRRFETPDE